jgi:hypothetical protein
VGDSWCLAEDVSDALDAQTSDPPGRFKNFWKRLTFGRHSRNGPGCAYARKVFLVPVRHAEQIGGAAINCAWGNCQLSAPTLVASGVMAKVGAALIL